MAGSNGLSVGAGNGLTVAGSNGLSVEVGISTLAGVGDVSQAARKVPTKAQNKSVAIVHFIINSLLSHLANR